MKFMDIGKNKCSFMAKWRPSWISLGGRKSWTNWPIPINLIFLSLSQHAAKNDTKYDYEFLKMEKNIFLLNALSGHFEFWKVADPRGVSNQFFFTYSWIIYKKGTFERQCAFVGHILKINIHPYWCCAGLFVWFLSKDGAGV